MIKLYQKRSYYSVRRNEKSSNYADTLFEAQKLAFSPVTFWVLATLIDLGVLELLSKSPLKKDKIQKKLNLDLYTLQTLLDAAFAANLLKISDNGRISTTKLSETFLYDEMTIANFNFIKDVCYLGLSEMKNSFISHSPKGLNKFFHEGETIYPYVADLPQNVKKSWFEFDHLYSDNTFNEALNIIFSAKTFEINDLGANTGKFANTALEFNNDVKVNLIDLEKSIKTARQNVKSNRATFNIVNILKEEFIDIKPNSVVFMSQFLDCFSLSQITDILNKIAKKAKNDTRIFILEPIIDNQNYEAANYSLSHISLYFTCLANGKSKMYNEFEIKTAIKNSKLKLNKTHYNIGKFDYTMFECVL